MELDWNPYNQSNQFISGGSFFLHTCPYQQGLCNTVALPFTLKNILKAKEELWKLKYFTMQKYNLQKVLQKKPKSFKIL
jgi:hypothetical protein